MSKVVPGARYAKSHEWVRDGQGDFVEIGITDHAQQALGDLVFVELPQVGRVLEAGEACAVVESVKAASDVYAPVPGTVVEINTALATSPELVNQDCYGGGWMIRVRPSESLSSCNLLDADDYLDYLDSAGR